MEKKLISIVSGCYNEEDNLREYYRRVTAVMDSLPQYDFECLLADNCSQDRSPELLEEIARRDRRFKVVFNLKNYGPERSGLNLWRRASGDALIAVPSDMQDPPELIPAFLEKWEAGEKLVWGQRAKAGEKSVMTVVRRNYYRLVASLSESREVEMANGYGLYDREVVDWVLRTDDANPMVRNLVTALGYTPFLIPYEREERKAGKSSYNLFRYISDALNGLTAASRAPLRLATYLGFATAGISLLVALVYLIYKLVFWNSFNAGMAPVVIGIFFLGAVQLICIGILGEYVGNVLVQVRRRPLVIEKRTLNFEDSPPENGPREEDEP